ncbi:hypothetical protein R2F61_06035 [Mollicutes bacterium LVI A0078]|nr:hypothetical protein RZE84_06040 [Mollicutes bacterium LVI A0075]WOO90290.1 hypothetical protein R2F61_06035 [Mollicutes bacterium LVI A0078]
MKKMKLVLSLTLVFALNVTSISFNADETFIADATHTVIEGSDSLSSADIMSLYHVSYNVEDTLTIDTSAIDYAIPGTYQIKFEDTNTQGNTETYYSDLVVLDRLPSIDLEHQNVQAVGNKTEDSYDYATLFGMRASEIKTGDLTSEVIIDSSEVVYDQVGHNTVYFTVSDDDGNTVTETGDLYFRELAPEIEVAPEAESVIGDELTNEELISLFEVAVISEVGVEEVLVDDSAVDYDTVGQYPVYFTAIDEHGNESETESGLLDIVSDEVELTLSADATHTVNEGSDRLTRDEIIDLYNVEYDTANTLSVITSAVDYEIPGTYQIHFDLTDDLGNSKSMTSDLVVADVKPTLSLSAPHVQALVNDPIDLLDAFGVVATEIQTGDLNQSVTVDDSEVDYMHVGHYPVYFSVSDDEQNVITAEGDLYLRSDAPTLTVDAEHSVEEQTVLTDEQLITLFNVTAEDTNGIDHIVVDTSAVDFNTPGRYSIIFTAFDIYGMESREYYAIIEITDLLPTLETDSDEINIVLGSGMTIEDVINIDASEITDNDLTNDVIIDDSQVDYDHEGSYQVYLTVSDDEGNVVNKTVTVNIVEESTVEGNTCLNNGGHPNNSSNCDDEDTTCNNNGNACTNGNNGLNGNNGSNGNNKKND